MRIILLTLLFLAPLYYFNQEEKTDSPNIDSIKVKMGAPDREERLLTVEKPVITKEELEAIQETPVDAEEAPESSGMVSDLEHVEEIQINDLEASWNSELKEMLLRYEPMDGEAIHETYLHEQESYQTELNMLLDEKQQKTTEEEILEVEYLIGQLDYNHQQKLREILGAHYEAVRDHYDYFMETASGP